MLYGVVASEMAVEAKRPILICLLGNFLLLKAGLPVAIPSGSKVEALLSILGLHYHQPVARDTLFALLWPNHTPRLAGQSLNTLLYGLRKQLGSELSGASPIVHAEGYYRLNLEAGVGIDLASFEELIRQGDRQRRANNQPAAMDFYSRAVDFYRGDLWLGTDTYAVTERERLRAVYLTVLSRLTTYYYEQQDYAACVDYARRLLASDPCREDAHRVLMRCYVRQGERGQALRQYQFCASILQNEFSIDPEPATIALYEQVRLNPSFI